MKKKKKISETKTRRENNLKRETQRALTVQNSQEKVQRKKVQRRTP